MVFGGSSSSKGEASLPSSSGDGLPTEVKQQQSEAEQNTHSDKKQSKTSRSVSFFGRFLRGASEKSKKAEHGTSSASTGTGLRSDSVASRSSNGSFFSRFTRSFSKRSNETEQMRKTSSAGTFIGRLMKSRSKVQEEEKDQITKARSAPSATTSQEQNDAENQISASSRNSADSRTFLGKFMRSFTGHKDSREESTGSTVSQRKTSSAGSFLGRLVKSFSKGAIKDENGTASVVPEASSTPIQQNEAETRPGSASRSVTANSGTFLGRFIRSFSMQHNRVADESSPAVSRGQSGSRTFIGRLMRSFSMQHNRVADESGPAISRRQTGSGTFIGRLQNRVGEELAAFSRRHTTSLIGRLMRSLSSAEGESAANSASSGSKNSGAGGFFRRLFGTASKHEIVAEKNTDPSSSSVEHEQMAAVVVSAAMTQKTSPPVTNRTCLRRRCQASVPIDCKTGYCASHCVSRVCPAHRGTGLDTCRRPLICTEFGDPPLVECARQGCPRKTSLDCVVGHCARHCQSRICPVHKQQVDDDTARLTKAIANIGMPRPT